ncbi:phosphomannomutase CpsG [Alteromonas sp. ASW11-36]|uniref:phosphomannomutase n=1 Tax=Alteromonas arenosi TaxID=3055817 RepID=A0ABT7SWW1_9ALTE|nr:phosphomannomutase CpsG [Alteromonas sp. ASW11-36]MDM7860678.1 phosphomannomutase CpsG [Alteromonas sp. ASW11-36]
MTKAITCFKAYDIRGKLVEQLDENIAYRIGKALVETLAAKTIVVGSDVRLTSAPLKQALAAGAIDAGATVTDIGMVGTEEIYFATKDLGVDAGIEVTASHNPIDYNGMKIVKAGSVPISGDTGLHDIQRLAESYDDAEIQANLAQYAAAGYPVASESEFISGVALVTESALAASGQYSQENHRRVYVEHVCSYVDINNLNGQKLVVNAGNGAAGPALDAIANYMQEKGVQIEFVRVHHEPDGTFPNGIPNPLLPESRDDTASVVKQTGANMGIAWDGDFDRCFLFDENGDFIEGYYIVGLLAEAFLTKHSNAKIIYDPRVYWNTEAVVEAANGQPIKSKTGHAFIKERMRKEDAVYGGEMSAHHYFRDFAYCDSGMIPWLLVAELIATKGQPLSTMVSDRIAAFPSSGEINSLLKDADAALARVVDHYQSSATVLDDTDGVGMEFGNWRFNLRKSNTEPVIRLNVESKGDIALMEEKTAELLALIRA